MQMATKWAIFSLWGKRRRRRRSNYRCQKKANEEGLKGLSYSDIILNESIEKMKKEGEQILKQLGEIKTSLDELDKIALKPRVLTNVEFLQQIIDYEKQEKKDEYKKRIEIIEIMKIHFERLNGMSKAENIIELIPYFNNLITELKSENKSNCLII